MVKRVVDVCNVCDSDEDVEEVEVRVGRKGERLYDLCAEHRKPIEDLLETVKPNEPTKKRRRNGRRGILPEDIPRA